MLAKDVKVKSLLLQAVPVKRLLKNGLLKSLVNLVLQFFHLKAIIIKCWGVPLSLTKLDEDTRFGIFEVGMNHEGEIEPLLSSFGLMLLWLLL